MATATRSKTQGKIAQTDETVYGEREDGSLSGNVTRDPEMRFTPAGKAVCNFSVAVNERVKNEETGQWEDTDPEFYRVTVWGQQAENIAEEILRGDRIVAVGYFQDRTFTNKNTGERQTVTEFTARDIGPSFLFRSASIKRVQRTSGK